MFVLKEQQGTLGLENYIKISEQRSIQLPKIKETRVDWQITEYTRSTG